MNGPIRSVATIAGLIVICIVAHLSVTHSGGYFTARGLATVALAIAAAAVGVVVPHVGRRVAMALGAAVIVAEVGGAYVIARQIATEVAAERAPRLAAMERRAAALLARDEARAALRAIPATTDRIRTAEQAVAAAATASAAKAAEKDCRAGCVQLLNDDKARADRELAEARGELASMRSRADAELGRATRAIEALPPAIAAHPLASALGIDGDAMDIAHAATSGAVLMLLGSMLVGVGASVGASGKNEAGNVAQVETASAELHEMPETAAVTATTIEIPAAVMVSAFLQDRCRARRGAKIASAELHAAFRDWTSDHK
jgi:hypothetical protein